MIAALPALLLAGLHSPVQAETGGHREESAWMESFYAPRAYAPDWGGAGSPLAARAQALLAKAGEHGLSPDDYAVAPQAASPAQADAALTLAMLRYLHDLRAGRTSRKLDAGAGAPAAPFDPAPLLRQALAAGRLDELPAAAAPQLPLYHRLTASLARYRELAAQRFDALPSLPSTKALAPGDSYRGAAALRVLLRALGDLEAGVSGGAGEDYAPELAEAVARFQDRHGLAADGKLGAQTMAALQVPLSRRVRQIELALERLRWLPGLRGPLIAINLPSYRLWAFRTTDAAAQPALAMRVIVGRAGLHPTPLFIGQLRYVEFHPYWNVPTSITRSEILPALARDPGYLATHDMELVDRQGRPAGDGDGALAALRAGSLRVRQRPGPQNALGPLKFGLPNAMDIYLHGTPARQLFQATRRDFSHGCIRVEQPAALAAFVLEGQAGWNPDAVEEALAQGQTRNVPLRASLPVVIFYATALAGQDGRTLFANDIYGLDAELEAALQAAQAARRRTGAAPH